MRMELTVNSARVYGKVLNRGDVFEVPDKEARLWGALARAKPAREEAGKYQTANLSAASADDAPRQHKQHRSGRYPRRDMRAEDE